MNLLPVILEPGCDASCAGALYTGLAWLLLDRPDFNKHFLELGFVSQIVGVWEALKADIPVVKMCSLIRALMCAPIEDAWVEPLMSLVPVLVSFSGDEPQTHLQIVL